MQLLARDCLDLAGADIGIQSEKRNAFEALWIVLVPLNISGFLHCFVPCAGWHHRVDPTRRSTGAAIGTGVFLGAGSFDFPCTGAVDLRAALIGGLA